MKKAYVTQTVYSIYYFEASECFTNDSEVYFGPPAYVSIALFQEPMYI